MMTVGLSLMVAAAAVPASAGERYTCGTGTIRSVQAVTERVAAGTLSRQSITYLVTVQLGNLLYTSRSSGTEPWNLHPTELRIDERVNVCANAVLMVLERADAKDFRATVVRTQPAAKAIRRVSGQ